MKTLKQLEWLGQRYRVTFEKYLNWKLTLMEEDGGAWMKWPSWRSNYEGKTLSECVEKAWADRKMDDYLRGVLVYRELNYPGITDEELGLDVLLEAKR